MTKVDRLHNKVDFIIGELKSQKQSDVARWHLYFKGSQYKREALSLLLATIRNSDLNGITQPTVRCQYVKTLGSDKQAWRAIRLTFFDGNSIKELFSSRLRVSLDSQDFDKATFSTVKGKDKQMDDVYQNINNHKI